MKVRGSVTELADRLSAFVAYQKKLKGDEKSEAQVFCDRLFLAFGHKGYKEAGAELEYRIRKLSTKGTSFADLVWKPRVLIEMKKRGEKLSLHFKQAFDYWVHAVPDRPRYVVLCNFDEFWIYDFDKQIDEPVDMLRVKEVPQRYTALNFLFPDDPPAIFGNDREEVSRAAADKVAALFNSLVARGTDRQVAQRFTLQAVVAMFAEDMDLLPSGMVFGLAQACIKKGESSYDLLGGLFHQMNNPIPAPGGRYKKVQYFNGGLFARIQPVDLNAAELDILAGEDGVARRNWSKVNPAIFGTLFQQSMDAVERHAYGAHYTSEADIMRIVDPTIVKPWQQRIAAAATMKDLLTLRNELMEFKVLDPASGSGNFLYVSYREMVRLEISLLAKLKATVSAKSFEDHTKAVTLVSPRQFYGIERDEFGVELAKVTLMLAKKLALDEAIAALETEQIELPLKDDTLPLDNLDANFTCGDALFEPWPPVNVIVSNPPYQSKNKIQEELGRGYISKVRAAYPKVGGRADYCVYWLRKAHEHLQPDQRAGLVGTNTIRQNYSRMGGLDHIAAEGTITDAVSTMKWSGDAAVDVSIVNWIKGKQPGTKRLSIQQGEDPLQGWDYVDLPLIGPSLSFELDVTSAVTIKANAARGGCFQGQTHGHEGFFLTKAEAQAEVASNPSSRDVLFPQLIANDLLGTKDGHPKRYVIDFQPRTMLQAKHYSALFKRVETMVLPARKAAAKKEETRNKAAVLAHPGTKPARHHEGFLSRWWILSYPRDDMVAAIAAIPRYIACGRVTKRPIFEFIDTSIRPNDLIMVFPYADDYSFGILQSGLHWTWFTNQCSTLTGRPRYTSNTVFDTFPWPQRPSVKQIAKIAAAAVALRAERYRLKAAHDLSLRELYRTIDQPGVHPLKVAQAKLDEAVRAAYGMTKNAPVLAHLLALNKMVAARELAQQPVAGPGLPSVAAAAYVTTDRLVIPPL